MLYTIKGKEFDFNCTLGATIRIKSEFKKTYNQIISELDSMEVEDLAKLLYCGLNDSQITKEEFIKFIFGQCGMSDLMDGVEWFIKQIQYPGMSEEEIEKKLLEKREKAARYQI